jgi:hypothetical protein
VTNVAINGTIENSALIKNGTGLLAGSYSGSSVSILAKNVTASFNQRMGLLTLPSGAVSLTRSTAKDNTTVDVDSSNGGSVSTYGDNVIGTLAGALTTAPGLR